MSLASTIPAAIGTLAGRMRFPQLFLLTAALFVLDLLIPDLIPFVDEVLFGLFAVLFGMWRHKTDAGAEPRMKDVTPRSPQHVDGPREPE